MNFFDTESNFFFVFFFKFNLTKIFFSSFFSGGGGGGGGRVKGGGVECTCMNKCFKWQFYSSRRTPVQNYFEIHAYKELWPKKSTFM